MRSRGKDFHRAVSYLHEVNPAALSKHLRSVSWVAIAIVLAIFFDINVTPSPISSHRVTELFGENGEASFTCGQS